MTRFFIFYLLVGALIMAAPRAFAQKSRGSRLDSLVRELPGMKEDTSKANALYTLSGAYFHSNADKGVSYGEQASALASKLGWKRGAVRIANTLGNCYGVKKDYNKAVENYLRSLKLAEDLGDRRAQVIALKNIANVYSYKIKDYQKAIDYYQQCAKIVEDLGESREAADVYGEMGSIYHMRREYGKAIESFETAMGKGESVGDRKIVGENLENISLVYKNQSKYPQALDFAHQAQQFYEAANDKAGISSAMARAAAIYNLQKNYQRALELLLKALSLSEETGRKPLIAENLQRTAEVYSNLGDPARALQYSLRALQMAEALGDKTNTGENLLWVGKCYYVLAENKSKAAVPDSLEALPVATRLQRAHHYLARGIDVQKETGNAGQLEETYEVLSKVQYLEGDREGSAESFKQHNVYVESMYNTDKGNEVARKDMQYVFEKKQETLKQESQQKEVAMQKEMQLNSLRYEYEKKQAAATSEREREQLRMEEDLKQKQITFEYERRQADIEQKAAIAKAELEKENAVNAIRLKEAKKERWYYIAGLGMLALFSVSTYNRFTILRKNKKLLEEKNRQIAAEKEIADQMRDRAENSEKFKQMFLANMSHEIRTPMNAVSGMTEILIEKSPRPDQVSYLQAISKSSDVLLHIINDILDLSKIEAGKMELEAIDFSLKDTVQQVTDTLAHRADEKGLQMLTDIDDNLTDVMIGDPFRLNQVLINLGGNAIKFTERGSVQIDIRKQPVGDDKVAVRFSIIDTGIGIPEDKINSLFGNFAQVNSSDTRKYGGTGLGLSISRQLVELHKGEISVESVLGSGTTFHFAITYPKGSPEKLEERIRKEKKADGSILNGLRILLADDNEYNRIVVNETLMLKADLTMDMVINGEEAVQAVRDNDYDVILMDVQMPVMNGIDATRAIRALSNEKKSKIPIIALTASTLRSDIDKCLQSGMNSYVPKPFKAWQLINTLADLTGRKHTGAPPAKAKGQEKKKQEEPPAPVYTDAKPKRAPGIVTDADYLYEFCEGDEKRVRKYIAMYLKGVPKFLEKLNEVAEARDMKEISLRIHAFKPNWLIMGMKKTNELGSRIEHQCAENNEQVFENIKILVEQTELSVKELNELLA